MQFYQPMQFYKPNKEIIDKMVLNVLCIILSGVVTIFLVIALSHHTYILLAALVTLLVILHQIQPLSLFLYVFCGLGGGLAEIVTIKFGANTWIYNAPTTPLNIPIWLPLVWSLAGVLIVTLNEFIKQLNELYKNKIE
jgi:hypothetical protein